MNIKIAQPLRDEIKALLSFKDAPDNDELGRRILALGKIAKNYESVLLDGPACLAVALHHTLSKKGIDTFFPSYSKKVKTVTDDNGQSREVSEEWLSEVSKLPSVRLLEEAPSPERIATLEKDKAFVQRLLDSAPTDGVESCEEDYCCDRIIKISEELNALKRLEALHESPSSKGTKLINLTKRQFASKTSFEEPENANEIKSWVHSVEFRTDKRLALQAANTVLSLKKQDCRYALLDAPLPMAILLEKALKMKGICPVYPFGRNVFIPSKDEEQSYTVRYELDKIIRPFSSRKFTENKNKTPEL